MENNKNEDAEFIKANVRDMANNADGITTLSKQICDYGLREMKLGYYGTAIEIFNQVDNFISSATPNEAVRNVADIVFYRGEAKLKQIKSTGREEGSVTALSAMEDFINAGLCYLEQDVFGVHFEQILVSLNETKRAMEMLSERRINTKSNHIDAMMKAGF